MTPNGWFLAFHLIGLFIYIGGLLNLSRLLGYHVKEEAAVRERLSWMEKRMYFFVTLPGLVIAVVFGLLMLYGVGSGSDLGVAHYLKPRVQAGDVEIPSYWYATFHAKFLLITILVCLDIYMGREIVKLGKGGEPPKAKKFKILHGLMALTIISIVILVKAGPLKGEHFQKDAGAEVEAGEISEASE